MDDGPQRRNWVSLAGTLLPWLLAGAALLNSVNGWVRTDATGVADTRYAARHAAEFEASVDRRLNEAVARMDLTDKDRDARTLTINNRVDGLAAVLHGRIDATNLLQDQRWEKRLVEYNALLQRTGALEIKLCALGGVRISGCK